VNEFTGTTSDDVFTAEPGISAITGAATTTINPTDSIDGGAGNDTLNITATAANNNSLTGLTVKGVEVVNITGANNLGGNSAAIAAAGEAQEDAEAALVTANAATTLAAAQLAAADEALDLIEAGEDDVVEAVIAASSVANAGQVADAFAYLDATYAEFGYEEVEAVGELTEVPAEATAFTLAQLKAAATASLTNLDGSVSTGTGDDADINGRMEALLTASDLAYRASLATTTTDAAITAIDAAYIDIAELAGESFAAVTLARATDSVLEGSQVAAAYEYLEGTAEADTVSELTDVAESTALPDGVTTFTLAQYKAAAAGALVDDDGDAYEDVDAVEAVDESATITFEAMSAGQSLTIAGATIFTTVDLTAIEVSEIFDDAAAEDTGAEIVAAAVAGEFVAEGAVVGSGTLAAWDAGEEAEGSIVFTSETEGADVDDITTSSVGGYEFTVETTDGVEDVEAVEADTSVDARLTVLIAASEQVVTTVNAALAGGDYSVAQLHAAIDVASVDPVTGVAFTGGEAAEVAEAAEIQEDDYEAAQAFAESGDFTFAQFKSAVTGSTVSSTGVSLLTSIENTAAIDARATVLAADAETVEAAATEASDAARAADTAASNALTVASADATNGTVSAAQFSGSNEVWLLGASTGVDVTGVTTQTIGLKSLSGMDNSIAFGATSGSVYLAASTGELTVTGAKALGISGTTTTLTLTAASSTSLDVDMSGANTLTLTDADALESITVSGAGKSTLKGVSDTVETITSTSGAVTATISTETVVDVESTDLDETVNATVTTADGADTITVATTGTGKTTVSTGAGADVIVIGARGLNARDSFDAGAGTDTMVFAGKTYTAQDYVVLDSAVTGVEVALYYSSVTADASKLGIPVLALESGGTLTEASSASIQTWGSLTASSTDYEETDGDVDTVYGGNLAVTLTGGTSVLTTKKTGAGSALTLNAEKATVTIAATSNGSITGTSIAGDLESLVVNMANSATKTADSLAATTITVTATENQALTSVDLNGTGSVVINTSAAGEDEIVLATIDASGLGGVTLYSNGLASSTKGSITGGLTFTGNSLIAETISLGSGTDSVTVNSTYEFMDTISGADFVKETSTAKSTSDTIIFGGLTLDGSAEDEIAELELTSGATSLNLAFVEAAASGTDTVFFHFDGDTYLFDNIGGAGLEDTDLAVKIVGIIDLTTDWGVYQG
jgi:hypothetical protein